jgi:hypothetical protein
MRASTNCQYSAYHGQNGYETCLLPQLERRAEATAGDFNSQGITNTLWAYATGYADAGVVQIHWQTLLGFFARVNGN